MNALHTITNNRVWNKNGVKIAWIVAILLLAIIIFSMVWTTWNHVKLKRANYQPQTIAPIKTASRPTYQVKDIVTANLFGDPTPAPVVKEAPKTTLDLTLVGVLWSSDNTVGRAIIMSGKKPSELYSLEEEIKGAGAKIEEIRDGEVILNRNGALESLPLKKIIDSNSRIVVSYPEDLPDDFKEFIDDHSSIEPSTTNRRSASSNLTERGTSNNQNRRVRRPNFSGLDQALKKMGEL